jgi:NAD(P)H-hydrate epimerase
MQLYTAEQTRTLDRCAIEEHGIPGIVLMKRAGRAAFDALLRRWPQTRAVVVLCGSGNNAGDGFVVAALARQGGLSVQLQLLGDLDRLRGDARRACDYALAQGLTPAPFDPSVWPRDAVLIDALLGTGLQGEVRPRYAEAIAAVNAREQPTLALDLPSGLCADTGRILGSALRADLTVTFIAAKRGLYTAAGPAHSGAVELADLAVPAAVFDRVDASTELMVQAPHPLPRRQRDQHKGHFGHVLVIGGDDGMGGAALMAAEAAARCGSGLVSVATRAGHLAGFLARRPELMARAVDSPAELAPLLGRASVVVVGPGLGQGPWGEALLRAVLDARRALVVDADALNLLAARPDWSDRLDERAVLTPHPSEMARLFGNDTATVQANRFAAAATLQQRFGGAVILKGAGTVVASAGSGEPHLAVCPHGNPGMASGGMGDVLSGVLAALLAQGLDPAAAARQGVWLHARAADLAAGDGERGLLATDLLPWLRRLVNAAHDEQ